MSKMEKWRFCCRNLLTGVQNKLKTVKQHKKVSIGVGIWFLTIICLFALVFVFKESYCETEACKSVDEAFATNLDSDVNPCEDFYSFTCGKWSAHNPRPDGVDSWTAATVLDADLQEIIIELLQNQTLHKLLSVKKVANSMSACQNLAARNEKAVFGLRKLMIRLQWPLAVKEWDSWSDFDIESQYAQLDKYLQFDGHPFFDYGFTLDSQADFKSYVLEVRRPKWTDDWALILRNEDAGFRKLKSKLDERIARLKSPADASAVDNDVDNLLDIHVDLMRISEDNLTDPLRTTFQEIPKDLQVFDWLKMFSGIFENVDVSIREEDTMVFHDVDYFEKLQAVISRYNKRTISNYMGAILLETLWDQLVTKNDIDGITDECYGIATKLFPLVMNHLIIRHYFDEESLKILEEFIDEAERSLAEVMQLVDTQIVQKLNAFVDSLTTFSWLESEEDLDYLYSGTGMIPADNFYTSYIRLSRWLKRKSLSLFDKIVASNLRISPSFTKPEQNPLNGRANFHSAILRPPFYHGDVPPAINFGSFASTLAYSLLVDKEFNLSMINASVDNSTSEDVTRTECLHDPFLEVVNLNDGVAKILKLHESVKHAFQSYELFVTRNNPSEDRLPDEMKSFTSSQLFFISFVNTWCETANGGHSVKHSSQSINLALSRSDKFRTAFDCPKESTQCPYHE